MLTSKLIICYKLKEKSQPDSFSSSEMIYKHSFSIKMPLDNLHWLLFLLQFSNCNEFFTIFHPIPC